MKFENAKVYNFEGALRGMRNPMNSWNKSDSWFGITSIYQDDYNLDKVALAWVKYDSHQTYQDYKKWLLKESQSNNDSYIGCFIGPADMQLAKKLIKAGGEHRKFMRQIFVTIDITAPIYWQIICQ